MAEGKLPNLSRLREQGSYQRLRTTYPALSPVAWSTFATGVNPAKHNIFDFLNRDLRSYAPELSSAKVRPSRRILRIGKFEIPLERPSVEMRRKSEPFWNILDRHGVDQHDSAGAGDVSSRRFQRPDALRDVDAGSARLAGNILFVQEPRRRARGSGERGADSDFAWLKIFSRSKAQRYPLTLGEYTPWIRLKFRAYGGSSVAGIVRFLLAGEEFSLYATPVQIDPENPALPISQPAYYATYLAKLLGSFATLGLAEDTWALNEGAIDEDAFLKQASVHSKRARSDVLQRARSYARWRAGVRFRYLRSRAAHVLSILESGAAGDRHAGVIEADVSRHGPSGGRSDGARRSARPRFLFSPITASVPSGAA